MQHNSIHFVKLHLTHRRFYTNQFSHKRLFTQMFFHTFLRTYAFTLCTQDFYTQTFLHTEAFTHRRFYTQTPSHKVAFTQRRLYTQTFVHGRLYTQTLLHTEVLTHTRFYALEGRVKDRKIGVGWNKNWLGKDRRARTGGRWEGGTHELCKPVSRIRSKGSRFTLWVSGLRM